MGLPSGLQWASCNVGAARPSDLGLYFSWGNIEGHTIVEGYDFSQNAYNSTPAASIDADLTLEQDAARVNLGEPWRMPTINECQELYDNCTTEWTTMKGVAGILFTSNVNGNQLFFPASGIYVGESLNYRGDRGYAWVSTYHTATQARRMEFFMGELPRQGVGARYWGVTVRAVYLPET